MTENKNEARDIDLDEEVYKVDVDEDTAPEDGSDAGRMQQLEAQLAQANQQAEEYKALALRMQADYENFKRRSAAEKLESYENNQKEFVLRILPMYDNLCRALASASSDPASIINGVEMIGRQFADFLASQGVEKMETAACVFDPELHEAVMTEACEDADENTVLQEFQSGYTIKGKLLRPAMVKVAKSE